MTNCRSGLSLAALTALLAACAGQGVRPSANVESSVRESRDLADIARGGYVLAEPSEVGLSRRPQAVIVVHLYGQSANLDPIVALCARFGVPLIEDAAGIVEAALEAGSKDNASCAIVDVLEVPEAGAQARVGVASTRSAAVAA